MDLNASSRAFRSTNSVGDDCPCVANSRRASTQLGLFVGCVQESVAAPRRWRQSHRAVGRLEHRRILRQLRD